MAWSSVFFVGGVFFELLGIGLVGAADYVPEVRKAAARFVGWLARLWAWLCVQALRRPPRTVTGKVSLGAAISGGGHVTATLSTGAETLEGKVEYLMRESERTQQRLNALEGSSEDDRAQVKAELGALRDEFRKQVAQAIAEATSEYVRARRLGLVCLGIGLVLFTASTIAS